ncbi:MAG TPA: pyruvate, water dikinase regulatory protein [Zoogloea sp.]|mgnify:FL=1|uniref:posphoenolpyruvate synthetase regulatory kinase/phosphorylase PpsR n=1 Tax=Zoogloea sp. TaxID=49181 RepID=UPI002D16E0F9|nr:pyruvate, water dikinase regulatory protein [Zoogloea sp.]HMV16784.1 pyruvate, water dikinase regulatory protein [Rhodocyclaceae bacterium]HMV61884.1 pyruvate, water dikinase regulatory protein [Rhodocyclaceae bacterium]HMW50807.1 pyruvate, water dikinase regulatory protein [Rhodocyclaceae bacterium]HMY48142.1 pyruvate, water dikinase regulatory protein [Rhodocyclaceae bacterium]HMZ74651.1 pyruvate, water dikinase regulatory protein [Rhodocyclaceae bacterium]
MSPTRPVFFISDGTGITAETLGHSLLAQFPDTRFRARRLPFIDSLEKARDCALLIREAASETGLRPIVFNTLVDPAAVAALRESDALFLDLFEKFIGPLESELGQRSTHTVGRFHGIAESQDYARRIEAINFTLAHDDGVSHADLQEADVILVGVSRSGKTPTSLYLAMQFGVKAANYPLIPEDFERNKLPGELARHRHKLFGLTIGPDRLSQIRQERRPNSRYASIENCLGEIEAAQRMMKREGIRWLDSTAKSIEEISTIILQEVRLNPSSF